MSVKACLLALPNTSFSSPLGTLTGSAMGAAHSPTSSACTITLYLSLRASTWLDLKNRMQDEPTRSGPFFLWDPQHPAPSTEPCHVDTQILANSVKTTLGRDALQRTSGCNSSPAVGSCGDQQAPCYTPQGAAEVAGLEEAALCAQSTPTCPEESPRPCGYCRINKKSLTFCLTEDPNPSLLPGCSF